MFYRILVKVVVDFTACVHFRTPIEVRGLHFSFSLLSTVVLGMVCALSQDNITMVHIMSGCCAGIILSFTLLLVSLNRAYVPSFFDTRTALQYLDDKFTNKKSDKYKIDIFCFDEGIWRPTMGQRVKVWLSERLPVWQR